MNKLVKKGIFSIALCFIVLISNFCTSYAASDYFKFVLLSDYSQTLDIGDEFYLFAITSNGKRAKFKSSNSKVASVNTYGLITAKKSGKAVITAKISGAEARCKINVRKTTIKLNYKSIKIENGETIRLTAKTSNRSEVTWKVNKKSIATIEDNGVVTAHKPGVVTVTAKADNTSVTCKVTVKNPTIKLNKTRITMNSGQYFKLSANVSSGIAPTWKSSRKSIAIIDDDGLIYALKPGTTVVTAKVDGVSKTCIVTVK